MHYNLWNKVFLITPIKIPLTQQEVLPYVVSEPSTNKIPSLYAIIINKEDKESFSEKLTIIQEETPVASYTTLVE